MKKKIIWLVVSCLVVAALLLASCAPAADEEEEVVTPPGEEEVAPPEEEEVVRDSLGRLVEKPRYGGVLTLSLGGDILDLDGMFQPPFNCFTVLLTNEDLLTGDITKGPRGTGEASWSGGSYFELAVSTGCLAESWEITDDATVIIFHIRKGVHWHDKPPVNGRELTADDVVFSIERVFEEPLSYIYKNLAERPKSVTALDKYTVEVKSNPGELGPMVAKIADALFIVPPEMVELYGDMKDWRNSCGTGPFILIDYVSNSSATLVRNPNYWGTDPFHPQNTLPYLDGVKFLVIPDASTQLSAMRTGKLDRLSVGWESAADLRKTNPELHRKSTIVSRNELFAMRLDKGLPFDDIRVRQALSMALDRQAIVDYLYGGEGEALTHPIAPLEEFSDIYIPLDQLPQSIREIYEYHPDKAKELLAEAGYPDGFKTEIICYASWVDMLSIYKDYWSKIGVDLELNVREPAVYASILYGKKHNEMIHIVQGLYAPFKLQNYTPGLLSNQSNVNDPRINEAREAINDAYFDSPKRNQVLKEITPYILEQVYYLPPPVPYTYNFWQPWLKAWHGETYIGQYNTNTWVMYVWLDQDLKYEMTGKR